MTPQDAEKLEYAEDLLKDWSTPRAHQAAYEYLAHAMLYSDDHEVQDKAQELMNYAVENGLA